ncbi:MAG: hypothetical protein DRH17_02670 [Deltaproteobacteria bacterium]|nr:MAG: hypothetical protein DRH17_02670 [Deltaproteobacteria bacterium]
MLFILMMGPRCGGRCVYLLFIHATSMPFFLSFTAGLALPAEFRYHNFYNMEIFFFRLHVFVKGLAVTY